MAIDLTSALDEETKKARAFAPAPIEKQFGPTVPTLGQGLSGMTRAISGVGITAPPPASGISLDNSVDMKGANDIMARENKARGEMVALSMPQVGGPAPGILGDGGIAADNAEKTARWRQDDLMGKLGRGRGSDAAIAAALGANARSNDVAGTNAAQLQAAELQNQAARYGHDVNAQRFAEANQVQMRGQDMTAAEAAARTGIDRDRLGILRDAETRAGERTGLESTKIRGEIGDQQMVRDARSGLTAAIASGDPKKIEAAKANAVAAGIKFDKPNNEFTAVTDSMGMNVTRTNKDTGAVDIINPKTGEVRSIAAPGARPAAPTYDAFAAQVQAKNPGAKLTPEQIQQAYKAQFGG